jgi:uncharacterized protein YbjT (DUF2867 family)
MKIVVIGGSGRIGSKVIKNLRERGPVAVAADLNTGINTIFQTSGRNLLKAEVNAGVGHHVALSIVGADRLPDSGYMRAKVARSSSKQPVSPTPSFAPRSSLSS